MPLDPRRFDALALQIEGLLSELDHGLFPEAVDHLIEARAQLDRARAYLEEKGQFFQVPHDYQPPKPADESGGQKPADSKTDKASEVESIINKAITENTAGLAWMINELSVEKTSTADLEQIIQRYKVNRQNFQVPPDYRPPRGFDFDKLPDYKPPRRFDFDK